MPTRNGSGQGNALRSDAWYGERGGNPDAKASFGYISDRIPQRANLLSKAEYDAMPNDYKTTINGEQFVMVMDAKGGTSLAPWVERDARIPKGKSAWGIGRDEARGYGMDDEALTNAQRAEAGGRGKGHTLINPSIDDNTFGGFKVNYPDAYRQSYDSYLIDSTGNSKSVKVAAVEALKGLYGKATERMSSSEIKEAVNTYVKQKLGERFKGSVKWNIKSYPD